MTLNDELVVVQQLNSNTLGGTTLLETSKCRAVNNNEAITIIHNFNYSMRIQQCD